MEEAMRRRHIPAFGGWNHCEMLPAAAQYAATVPPAALLHGGGGGGGFHGGYAGGGGHLYPPHLPYSYYWQDPGEDLFQVPPPPPVVVAAYPRKARKEAPPEKQLKRRKQPQDQQKKGLQEESAPPPQQTKQGKVCDCNAAVQQKPQRRTRAAMAVDEDLYKVPPKLLCEKSRRKKMVMSDFWSRCLGLSCIP